MKNVMTTLNPAVRNLGLLLVVQLAVAGGLLAWQMRTPADGAQQALFSFDKAAVDRLVIEGPDKAKVELQRQGSGDEAHWVVAQADNFPADAERVRQAIDKLHGLKAGSPMATSAEAVDRFKVADENFERRVQAEAGGKAVATLLLGSSQSARQTAARKPGESVVLGVDWATWDIGTRTDDWLDKGALTFAKADIEAIEIDGLRLAVAPAAPAASGASGTPGEPAASAASSAPATTTTTAAGATSATTADASGAARSQPRWTATGLPAGQALNEGAADRLAQAIADLRFDGLRPREGLGAPELSFKVQRRGQQPVEYVLHKLADTEDRALVVSNRKETFKLAAHQARPLLDAGKRQALLGSGAH